MLVHHFLEKNASARPNKVALICGDRRLTYGDINEQADVLAAALIRMGIRRRDRVVLFLDNSVESVIALFGVLKAGAVFIMARATMKVKKLNFILKDTDAKVLITHSKKAKVVQQALADELSLTHVIWCHPPGVGRLPETGNPLHDCTATSWSSLFDEDLPNGPTPFPKIIDIDLAAIFYTSGSTGDPKGVMYAHYNVVSAVRSITRYLENTSEDIVLNALPLSFDHGLYQILTSFSFGGTLVLERSFAFPYKTIEKIDRLQVTGFPIVPTTVALLLEMDGEAWKGLSSLRYFHNASEAIPLAHLRRLRDRFPHVKIYSMYNLAECKAVSGLSPQEITHKPDSVGIPMPNVDVFIVDRDGREVGTDRVGELVVKGSGVMQGYWNAPEKTVRALRRDPTTDARHLLHTGDLFRRDEEGYLYFVGRRDDLFKTKGERISPKEIESTLCEFSGVQAAAVIGVPDKMGGRTVKAFIKTAHSKAVNDKHLLEHCATSLEPFLVPKYIEYRRDLPKLPDGNIDKEKLDRSGTDRRINGERRQAVNTPSANATCTFIERRNDNDRRRVHDRRKAEAALQGAGGISIKS